MITEASRHTVARPGLRELSGGRPPRAWLLAWLGGPVIGIGNGVARELVYKERVGDLTASQISTGTGIALFALYFWILQQRWPLRSTQAALSVGAAWLFLTVLFEFGFGHYVDRKTWSELLHDYNVPAGRLWPLVLVWLLIGPAVVRRLHGRSG